ncbi:MAG: hypothetical protein ACLTDR_03715 [Adlercreutzia equolifaciens]
MRAQDPGRSRGRDHRRRRCGATGGAMQTTDPAKAVWPVVEEVEVGSAGEGVVAFVAEPIAADEIVATHDVDVVVCGLWTWPATPPPWPAPSRGLKTVAVEKQNRGNYNSATIGGTNSELHKFWGMEYDTTEWMSDAMIGCSFQADMTLYQHYLEKNGEAVNWYISHFDNQDFNDYPHLRRRRLPRLPRAVRPHGALAARGTRR